MILSEHTFHEDHTWHKDRILPQLCGVKKTTVKSKHKKQFKRLARLWKYEEGTNGSKRYRVIKYLLNWCTVQLLGMTENKLTMEAQQTAKVTQHPLRWDESLTSDMKDLMPCISFVTYWNLTIKCLKLEFYSTVRKLINSNHCSNHQTIFFIL